MLRYTKRCYIIISSICFSNRNLLGRLWFRSNRTNDHLRQQFTDSPDFSSEV